MKCPKCGYTSFDHNDFCPKCKKSISDTRAKLNLPAFMANPISVIASGNGQDARTAAARDSAEIRVNYADPVEEAVGLDIDLDDLTLRPDLPAGGSEKTRSSVVPIGDLASDISEIDLAIESLDEEDLEPIGHQKRPSPNSKPGVRVVRKGADTTSDAKDFSVDLEDLDLDLDVGRKK